MKTTWNHPGLALAPLAPAVGPFTTADFLTAVSALDEGEHFSASTPGAFLALQRVRGWIHFAGDPDYTDYHSPLGTEVADLIVEVARAERPQGFLLDSLPVEAVGPLVDGLERAGWRVDRSPHQATAVVDLPPSYDDYLGAIGKKERHEVRRKRRRYEKMVGEVRVETHEGWGWALDEFFRLHRLSGGAKAGFMTPARQAFFSDLAEGRGWRVDVLCLEAGQAAAAAFGYGDADGYYLYNSAYDPALAAASPGMVLIAELIRRIIDEGCRRFDFLKGDEAYKFRLGAHRRHLYQLTARMA